MPSINRIIMLVDLDYFFAQCEELRNPALKEKPVVVGVYSGRTKDSGAVSTANYIARKFGVKSGLPLYLAKKRLEGTDAVFLPVDTAFYEQISNKIMKMLRGYADAFEQVGIDEAYLDVTKKVKGDFSAIKALVQEMKSQIKSNVGITFSVGVGPNKLVAKIAVDRQKPDGLTIVKPEDVQHFISPLPVDQLLGVGRKTAAKMAELGIKTLGDLANYDVQRLVEIFGKKLGTYFYNGAKGTDNEPVHELGEAESISRIATLKEDTRDVTRIMEKVNHLIEKIYEDATQKRISFRQIAVIAVMTDLSAKSRSQTLETASRDINVLKRTVQKLFERLLSNSQLEIRRVGVKIAHFSRNETAQQQLIRFLKYD